MDLAGTIPKEFLRGGFDNKDVRRPSLFVGVCVGGNGTISDKRSLGMIFDDGQIINL